MSKKRSITLPYSHQPVQITPLSPEEAAQYQFHGFVPAAEPVVEAPRGRTFGEAVADTGRSLMSGAAGLVKTGGDLYGLATGDMDNVVSRAASDAQDYWQEGMSDDLKRRKAARQAAIDSADGVGGKFMAALGSTVTDPALAVDTLAENAMTMLPGAAVGRGLAVSRLAAGAAPAAAARLGVAGAIGTGAVQQGGDVSGDVYRDATKVPAAALAQNPEFVQRVQAGEDPRAVQADLALSAARATMIPAAGISVLANALPGGAVLERALVGGAARGVAGAGVRFALPKAIAKGALGEGVQETVEEGGGAYSGNVAKRAYVDPNQDLTAGVGEAAGLGAAGGIMLGGAGGTFHARHEQRPDAAAAAGAPPDAAGAPPAGAGATPAGAGPLSRAASIVQPQGQQQVDQIEEPVPATEQQQIDPETGEIQQTGPDLSQYGITAQDLDAGRALLDQFGQLNIATTQKSLRTSYTRAKAIVNALADIDGLERSEGAVRRPAAERVEPAGPDITQAEVDRAEQDLADERYDIPDTITIGGEQRAAFATREEADRALSELRRGVTGSARHRVMVGETGDGRFTFVKPGEPMLRNPVATEDAGAEQQDQLRQIPDMPTNMPAAGAASIGDKIDARPVGTRGTSAADVIAQTGGMRRDAQPAAEAEPPAATEAPPATKIPGMPTNMPSGAAGRIGTRIDQMPSNASGFTAADVLRKEKQKDVPTAEQAAQEAAPAPAEEKPAEAAPTAPAEETGSSAREVEADATTQGAPDGQEGQQWQGQRHEEVLKPAGEDVTAVPAGSQPAGQDTASWWNGMTKEQRAAEIERIDLRTNKGKLFGPHITWGMLSGGARKQVEQHRAGAGAAAEPVQAGAASQAAPDIAPAAPDTAPAAPHVAPAADTAAKNTGRVAPKFRDPDTGYTWSGRGIAPKWIKEKLAAGSVLADFEVTQPEEAPPRAADAAPTRTAPGQRINGQREKTAAAELERIHAESDDLVNRNLPVERGALNRILSVAQELKRESTPVSVQAVLGQISDRLRKKYPAVAQQIGAVAGQLGAQVDQPVQTGAAAPIPTVDILGARSQNVRWQKFSPKERREILAKAGYTDADQARSMSGVDWSNLTDTVRRAIDAAHAPETSKPSADRLHDTGTGGSAPAAAEPVQSGAVVKVPESIDKAAARDMQRAKSEIRRGERAVADAEDMQQVNEYGALLKEAREDLRQMRLKRFDADDAALRAIQTGNAAEFDQHSKLFPSMARELQKEIERAKPAPAAPEKAEAVPAAADTELASVLDDELRDALGHLGDVLGDVFGAKANITGPQHTAADLLPALSKVVSLLVRKGFKSFADSTRLAAKAMRADARTAPHVDKITARQWKAAYNAIAEGHEGTDSEDAVHEMKADDVLALVAAPAPAPAKVDAVTAEQKPADQEEVREGDALMLQASPEGFEQAYADAIDDAKQSGDPIAEAQFAAPKSPVKLTKPATFVTPEDAGRKIEEWRAEARRQGASGVNASRTVLSLFDHSGVWSEPWREAGYNVVQFDIQDGRDIGEFSASSLLEEFGNDEVWAVLAAPPCTDFASSGAQFWRAKDLAGRTEASNELVRQTLRTVELMRPAVWAMENPIGRIARLNGLPAPTLTFDPYHFGDPFTKRTQLWGNFNPELEQAAVDPVEGSKITDKLSGRDKNARSQTPEGFAWAFFQANNFEGMPVAARLAAEFRAINPELIDRAVAAGMSESKIRSIIEDAYNDRDIEGAEALLDAQLPEQNRGTSNTTSEEQDGSEKRAGDGGSAEAVRSDDQAGVGQDPGRGDLGAEEGRGADAGVEGAAPADVGTPERGAAGEAAGDRAARPGVSGPAGVPAGRDANPGRKRAGRARLADAGAGERAAVDPADQASAQVREARRANYRITDPKAIVGGSPKKKFARNRAALETLERLTIEGTPPTQEDLDALASWIGWGSFGQELFQGSFERPIVKDGWADEARWLREHLGKEAWESAQRTTINAHFTDPPVVTAMWDMVRRLGFKGGRVLEPSIGVGNFYGLMPQDLAGASQLSGIELDSTTGRMAQILYPQANIQIKGYQDSQTADGFYDLVIGNWPFFKDGPADRRYNKLAPSLHDYFFLKALDQTRPGGLVVGITSAGTMDKAGTSVRTALARKGDLVASIRLPSGAFEDYAGTKVVTDIVILKRRAEDNPNAANEEWVKRAEVDTPSGQKLPVNNYYAQHPEQVLGTLDFGHGTTYGRAGMIVTRPADLEQRLQRAIEALPENVVTERQKGGPAVNYVANNTSERQNAVVDQGGVLHVVAGEQLAPLHEVARYRVKSEAETARREAQVRSLVGMRGLLGRLMDAERAGADTAEKLRTDLRGEYEKFVKDHGPINTSKGMSILEAVEDPHASLLRALESPIGKKGVNGWSPAKILTEATVRPRRTLTKPTVRDAYVIARNESRFLNLGRIAELAGADVAAVERELIDSGIAFKLPDGSVEPSDVYLSGNVRRKLREAEEASQAGADMARNIEALKRVQPKDVPYFSIEAKLGAMWVGEDYYRQFVSHLLAREIDPSQLEIRFTAGTWKVAFGRSSNLNSLPEATTQWGTPDISFDRLLTMAMGNQTATIKRRDSDGNYYVDDQATAAANEKLAKLREEFSTWAWGDPVRRLGLERAYNEIMNATADSQYDGSFLTFEGMALNRGTDQFSLRKHQIDHIWRGLVHGKSMAFHEVGTGKTYTMGGLAIESRRYGLARKPMILAHNANSASVAREIQEMYPGAKLLYINNLDPATIDTKLRQISMDDWDAVVIPHSLLDRFTLKRETLESLVQDDIQALIDEATKAAEDDGATFSEDTLTDEKKLNGLRSVTAKQLVKQILAIREKVEKDAQRASREGAVTFEDLGIDMVIVDEAHEFKKPPFVTKMKIKGLSTSTSARSVNLRFLTDYIKRQNNGRGVHTFTGTPITNTLAEIYHQMRYVMDAEMARDGLRDWDAWFNTFADSDTDVELTASGEYEPVNRLAQFVNVPELRRIAGEFMSTVFADDMPEFKPRSTASGKTLTDPTLTAAEREQLLNGRTENAIGRPYKQIISDVGQMGTAQAEILEKLAGMARAFKAMTRKERKENSHIPLLVETGASKAGLDVRLYEPSSADEPGSKVNRVVKNVLHHFAEHEKATQVIFVEQGYSDKTFTYKKVGDQKVRVEKPAFNMVADIRAKLIAGGMKEHQIAVVDGSTKPEQRKAIADAMNAAEVRVVIGSTATLGVGVNMQRNLRAMHHMDAPWMPGDLAQRNGRGHRQGNQWNTVMEYRYITEKIDGRRWQVLAVKDRFIQRFMKADDSVRVIDGDAVDTDETDDIAKTLSEAAGDPRLLMLNKYRTKAKKLEARERVHTQGIVDAKHRANYEREWAKKDERDAAEFDRAGAAFTRSVEEKKFKIEVGGQTYTKRDEASEALVAAEKGVKLGGGWQHIGSLGDFSIEGNQQSVIAPPRLRARIGDFSIDVDASVQSITARLRNLKPRAAAMRERAAERLASAARLDEAAKAPFGQQAQLEQMRTRAAAIEADIASNPVAAPAWLRNGAPLGTDAYVDGAPVTVTGHSWTPDAWLLKVEDAKGEERSIDYTAAKDQNGIPLFQPRKFEPPKVVAPAAPAGEQKPADKATVVEVEAAAPKPAAAPPAKPAAAPAKPTKRSAEAEQKWSSMATSERERAIAALKRQNLMGNASTTGLNIVGVKLAERRWSGLPEDLRHALADHLLGAPASSTAPPATGPATVKSASTVAEAIGRSSNLREAVEWLAGSSSNRDYAAIARRILPFIGNPELVVISNGKDVPGGVPTSMHRARGAYFENFETGRRVVYLKDSTFNDPGTTEDTLLHEALHAATNERIRAGNLQKNADTDLGRAVQGLYRLQRQVAAAINERIKSGTASDTERKLVNQLAASDPKELVAWGMTDRDFQGMLRGIQVERTKSAWREFVDAVRSILGLDAASSDALSELISVTDNILSAESIADPSFKNAGSSTSLQLASGIRDALTGSSGMGTVLDSIRSTLADATRGTGSFNLWHRTVGTQFHKAQVNPVFRRVYDAAQSFISDTSFFANTAANLAPGLLPRLEKLGDLKRRLALKESDRSAVARAVFGGTLENRRLTWDELRTGTTLGGEQVKLSDEQIKLYRQFRAAVDNSLTQLASAELYAEVARQMGDEVPVELRQMLSEGRYDEFQERIQSHVSDQLTTARDKQEAMLRRHRKELAAAIKSKTSGQKLNELKMRQGAERKKVADDIDKWGEIADTVTAKYQRLGELIDQGYAPLMRFGEHAVTIQDPDSKEVLRFDLYESAFEANRAARAYRADDTYAGAAVTVGRVSQEAFKLFRGVSPETLSVFGDATGMGNDEAFQKYLRLATANHSALRRMIHRKGRAGFSEDPSRVLAAFLTSNARRASSLLHNGDMDRAVEAARESKLGDVADEAYRLREYVQNPQPEAAGLKNLMFVNYIGGSVASALVNLTQPVTMTFPYLSQWGGPAKAAARLAAAARDALGGVTGARLIADLQRAEAEGIIAPQSMHELQAEAMGSLTGNPMLRKGLFAWGSLFGLAEAMNRRVSFIAAYRTALAEGMADPFEFARVATIETQGEYNKANRPNWARGAIGGTLFTFKQFSISYMEFLSRLPHREKALALAVLLVMAGLQGMPGADDLDDIIDTIGQQLGYSTNARRWKSEALRSILGDTMGGFVERGITGMPGVPIDVAGRMSLGNLIPASGIMKKSANQADELWEIGGPAASMVKDMLTKGKIPLWDSVALGNIRKGADMLSTGQYRDERGRKVIDASPGEAAAKMIGFQPGDVAREQRRAADVQKDIGLAKKVHDQIVATWAEGVASKDSDLIDEARAKLADWNEKNPESRLVVKMPAVLARVRAMRQSRAERIEKSAPRSMRSDVRAAIDG